MASPLVASATDQTFDLLQKLDDVAAFLREKLRDDSETSGRLTTLTREFRALIIQTLSPKLPLSPVASLSPNAPVQTFLTENSTFSLQNQSLVSTRILALGQPANSPLDMSQTGRSMLFDLSNTAFGYDETSLRGTIYMSLKFSLQKIYSRCRKQDDARSIAIVAAVREIVNRFKMRELDEYSVEDLHTLNPTTLIKIQAHINFLADKLELIRPIADQPVVEDIDSYLRSYYKDIDLMQLRTFIHNEVVHLVEYSLNMQDESGLSNDIFESLCSITSNVYLPEDIRTDAHNLLQRMEADEASSLVGDVLLFYKENFVDPIVSAARSHFEALICTAFDSVLKNKFLTDELSLNLQQYYGVNRDDLNISDLSLFYTESVEPLLGASEKITRERQRLLGQINEALDLMHSKLREVAGAISEEKLKPIRDRLTALTPDYIGYNAVDLKHFKRRVVLSILKELQLVTTDAT